MPVRSPKDFNVRLERRRTISKPNKRVAKPGRLHARADDRVRFKAPPDTDIQIWIPKARELFGVKEPLVFTVKSNKTSKPYKIVARPREETEYAYSVYCTKDNQIAEANSSPVMVIEPPPDPGRQPKGPGIG